MKRQSCFLLFIAVLFLSGCPEKQKVPPPQKPPEPQVEKVEVQGVITYEMDDVVEILKGMAPLVGPAPYFYRMLA